MRMLVGFPLGKQQELLHLASESLTRFLWGRAIGSEKGQNIDPSACRFHHAPDRCLLCGRTLAGERHAAAASKKHPALLARLIHAQVVCAVSLAHASTEQEQEVLPMEHFAKLRVSQLQAFLKDRGQRWDFAEKRALPLPLPLLLLLLLLLPTHTCRRAIPRRLRCAASPGRRPAAAAAAEAQGL
jgi:hypothetical protein